MCGGHALDQSLTTLNPLVRTYSEMAEPVDTGSTTTTAADGVEISMLPIASLSESDGKQLVTLRSP